MLVITFVTVQRLLAVLNMAVNMVFAAMVLLSDAPVTFKKLLLDMLLPRIITFMLLPLNSAELGKVTEPRTPALLDCGCNSNVLQASGNDLELAVPRLG